ncbi:MAG: aminotransferase class I/II-fold pyridoxal phosphate-dependent enzyme, partial [Nitrososphaerales archaeon]
EQAESELQDLREEVAETTKEIIKFVARRAELAKRIGEVKSRGSLPIDNEKVEDALLEDVLGECKRLGLDQQLGAKILSTLLKDSKKTQRAQVGGRAQPLITPMVMMAKATEIEKSGKKLIRLDVGEPDFRPPKAVLDAVSDALYSYETYYTVGRGIPELLSALKTYLRVRYNYREAAENQLIVTPGGRFAVYSALATVASEGDSVVVIEPNWPAYKEGLDYIGARAITIRTTMEEGWEPSPERVKAAIRPNTKAIILSYPANPTGKIMDRARFREIVEVADDDGLTVISDEIYNDYAYKECPTILEKLPRKYILTSSFSKAWSMTGFRVGYSFAPAETSARMLK